VSVCVCGTKSLRASLARVFPAAADPNLVLVVLTKTDRYLLPVVSLTTVYRSCVGVVTHSLITSSSAYFRIVRYTFKQVTSCLSSSLSIRLTFRR
jgi:hypothetical protein